MYCQDNNKRSYLYCQADIGHISIKVHCALKIITFF